MGTPPSQAPPGAAGQQAPERELAPRPPRQAGVERFDDAIAVTRARAWIGLAACLALVIGVVVWAATATVNRTVTGPGTLLVNGTISEAKSPVSGTFVWWLPLPGFMVRESQVMAWVVTPAHRQVPLRAPISGQLLSIGVGPGASVTTGQVLASVTAVRGPTLLFTFLPPSNAQLVAAGMRALVTFPGGQTMDGTVAEVQKLPVTRDQVAATIGSQALAGLVAPHGAVIVVGIAPTGKVSAARSHAHVGDLGSATIIVGSSHPISYVF